MDERLAALAASAATAMVSAFATDAWERMRGGIVQLWARYRPTASDEQVGAELDRTRAELLADDRPAEPAPELVAVWEERFRHLLEVEPAAAQALERLVAELAGLSGAAPEAGGGESGDEAGARPAGQSAPAHVEMKGEARDHGQVFQSGHTLNVRLR